MSTTAISVRHLVKHFPKVKAVNDISFDVNVGQCFGLLGPNGAGKTTTLEMLEGIRQPTSGSIAFNGQYQYHQFKEKIGIQFQSTALQEFLTVRETLRLFSRLYAHHVPIEELISLCTLEEFLDRETTKLSGGQRQRLLLALALIHDPEIVFLDEPTTGLDPQARRNFWDLIERIKKQQKTVILTTHYMDEAYILCDDIAIMDKGCIIARGSPQTLLADHYGETVIELPHDELQAVLPQLGMPYFQTNNLVEIPTRDLDATLKHLMSLGISFARLKIRALTLEDLFIALTGKALRP